MASPLQRALHTCQITFQPCIDRGLKILALPMAEEASADPSDTGRDPEVLAKEFPDIVDFTRVKPGWWKHEGDFSPEPQSVMARATKLRQFIRDRPEREVVLVSHGLFIHYLLGNVDENGEQTTPWWKETELRTFVFADDGDEKAMLTETEESRNRRDVG